tara:strand:+ start:433 stop:651 length:219 start_codon:yes stop_codon:yes gene_type:complete
MIVLIWAGTAISAVGLTGLMLCIRTVTKAKKKAENDDALRDAIKRVLPLNLGSLFLSALGLMTVVVGIILEP